MGTLCSPLHVRQKSLEIRIIAIFRGQGKYSFADSATNRRILRPFQLSLQPPDLFEIARTTLTPLGLIKVPMECLPHLHQTGFVGILRHSFVQGRQRSRQVTCRVITPRLRQALGHKLFFPSVEQRAA